MCLNIDCALLDENASVLRNILSGSDNMVFNISQERGNLDRKQTTVPVEIYSNAHVRLGNFNPPTFCLVYSIVARAWIHKCPSDRARHVYNSIWANWKKKRTNVNKNDFITLYLPRHRIYISDTLLHESFERKLFQRIAPATELWKYLVSL